MFKRKAGALAVLDRIAQSKPNKLYLLSDGGRDQAEHELVEQCRIAVEERVNWDCEVIRRYADTNVGVHANIGLGAKWVLEREDQAIFLEDDNLPEPSFFSYCEELLDKYREDSRIIWICGTNYLGETTVPDGASYTFTRHLLPCGWASWSGKFARYYDQDLELFTPELSTRIREDYLDSRLWKQDLANIRSEVRRRERGERYWSWDYHMTYSIRVHGLLGIVPRRNQIKNIGVDEFAAHGGVSYDDVMTQRFCGVPSAALELPLVHPRVVLRDHRYDRLVNRVVLYPASRRLKKHVATFIKRVLGRRESDPLFPLRRQPRDAVGSI